MKYFVLLISFFFLFLQGAGISEETFSLVEGNGELCVLQSDVSAQEPLPDSYLVPLKTEHPLEDFMFGDAQTMARQLVMLGRTQRQTSSHNYLFPKDLARRTIMVQMAALEQSAHHLYSTLPYLSWTVSSELYVFGMRRILI